MKRYNQVKIIKGHSRYFEGNPQSTTYYVTFNNKVFVRSCYPTQTTSGVSNWIDWSSDWSILQMYHEHNSSDIIGITADQFINNTIPERYIGQSLSAIYNYRNDDSIPTGEELDKMFDIEFESVIKSLERNCKLNQILC